MLKDDCRIYRLFLSVTILLLLTANFSYSDTIFFNDGSRLDVKRTWREGDQVKTEMFGEEVSYPATEIEKIVKGKLPEYKPPEVDTIEEAEEYIKNKEQQRARDIQKQRESFIQKAINAGIFEKVEVKSILPHLWVKSAFYSLKYDDKSKLVNIVYAYYKEKGNKFDLILLKDSYSGKVVGEYGPLFGLKMK